MKSDSIGRWTGASFLAAIENRSSREGCATSTTSDGGDTEALTRFEDEQRGLLWSAFLQDPLTSVGYGLDHLTRTVTECSEVWERIASSMRRTEEAFQRVGNSITFAESVVASIPPTWIPSLPRSTRHEEPTPMRSVLRAVADSTTSLAQMLGTSILTADVRVSLASGQTIDVEIRDEGDRTLVTVNGSEAGDGGP